MVSINAIFLFVILGGQKTANCNLNVYNGVIRREPEQLQAADESH